MAIRKFTVPVVTSSGGDAEAYSPYLSGFIEAIEWVKPGSGGITGATFAITAEATGETIWGEASISASTRRKPRAATHTTAGVAATYDGTRAALARIALGRDRVKIVISGGGNTLAGTFHIFVDDGR